MEHNAPETYVRFHAVRAFPFRRFVLRQVRQPRAHRFKKYSNVGLIDFGVFASHHLNHDAVAHRHGRLTMALKFAWRSFRGGTGGAIAASIKESSLRSSVTC